MHAEAARWASQHKDARNLIYLCMTLSSTESLTAEHINGTALRITDRHITTDKTNVTPLTCRSHARSSWAHCRGSGNWRKRDGTLSQAHA